MTLRSLFRRFVSLEDRYLSEAWIRQQQQRLQQLMCFVLGGHDLGSPQMKDGRYRLVCRLGCGYMSPGVQTRGQEQEQMERRRTVRPFRTVKPRETRARRSA